MHTYTHVHTMALTHSIFKEIFHLILFLQRHCGVWTVQGRVPLLCMRHRVPGNAIHHGTPHWHCATKAVGQRPCFPGGINKQAAPCLRKTEHTHTHTHTHTRTHTRTHTHTCTSEARANVFAQKRELRQAQATRPRQFDTIKGATQNKRKKHADLLR